MTIAREEIFGPCASVIKVADYDEALELANASDYGLQAAVFTKDLATAFWYADRYAASASWDCFSPSWAWASMM